MSNTEEKSGAGRWRRLIRGIFRRKTMMRMFWGGAALLTVWVLFFQVERWRGAKAWNETKKEYLEAGGSLDILELLPELVPAEDNFGALAIFKDIEFEESELGKRNRERLEGVALRPAEKEGKKRPELSRAVDKKEYLQSYVDYLGLADRPLTSEQAAKTLLDFIEQKAGDVFDEMRKGLGRTEAHLTGDRREMFTDQPLFNISLPHVTSVISISRTLLVRGIAAIEVGDRDVAMESVEFCFRLSKLMEQEFLVGLLVSISVEQVAFDLVRHGVNREIWGAGELERIRRAKEDYRLLESLVLAYQKEAIFSTQSLDLLKGGKERAQMIQAIMAIDDQVSSFKVWLASVGTPQGWLDLSKAETVRLYLPFLSVGKSDEGLRKALVAMRSGEKELKEMVSSFSPSAFFVGQILPAVFKIVSRVTIMELHRELMQVSCAVEKFRLAHSRLPEDLTELVPGYLPEVPKDPIDGSPLRYRPNVDEGYVLYSVGVDEEDNGGKLSENPWKYEKGTDVVWSVR